MWLIGCRTLLPRAWTFPLRHSALPPRLPQLNKRKIFLTLFLILTASYHKPGFLMLLVVAKGEQGCAVLVFVDSDSRLQG